MIITAAEKLNKMVMWVDPGLMSGWAMLHRGWHFTSGQCQFDGISRLIQDYGEVYEHQMSVGWEQFIITPLSGKHSTPGPSIESIGMMKDQCHRHDVLVLKPVPSAMRMLGSVEMLKTLDWYRPGKKHANDAAQHMLAWMLRSGITPTWIRQKLSLI